eukprot:COSAG01_NODE_177_length_22954_cov_28.699554_24_plen_149_part_00
MTDTKTARSLHLQLLAASRDHLLLVLRARVPPTSFMCAPGGGGGGGGGRWLAAVRDSGGGGRGAASRTQQQQQQQQQERATATKPLAFSLSLSLSYLQVGDQPLLRHQRLTGLLKTALRGCPARLDLPPLQLRPQRRNAHRSDEFGCG